MKKLITVVLAAALLTALMCIGVSAAGYSPLGESCGIDFEVKQADAGKVIKDGVIDTAGGEYERYTQDGLNDADELSPLQMNWGDEEFFEDAEEMLKSAEYYFSWDPTHGFNVAVKFHTGVDGNGCQQVYTTGTPNDNGYTMDDFMCNVGLNFLAGRPETSPLQDDREAFYYSVAKSTVDGSQVTGEWGQTGYAPYAGATMGVDYAVNYLGDGWVIIEYSVPLVNISQDGKTVEFAVTTTAGLATPDEEDDYETFHACWSVNFGQHGFLCQAYDYNTLAKATLSDTVIEGTPDTGNGNVTTGGGDNTGSATSTQAPVVTQVVTDDKGETQVVIVDENGETQVAETNADGEVVVPDNNDGGNGGQATNAGGNGGNTTPGAKTFDPVIIAGVAAAISAAGIVISKKRK